MACRHGSLSSTVANYDSPIELPSLHGPVGRPARKVLLAVKRPAARGNQSRAAVVDDSKLRLGGPRWRAVDRSGLARFNASNGGNGIRGCKDSMEKHGWHGCELSIHNFGDTKRSPDFFCLSLFRHGTEHSTSTTPSSPRIPSRNRHPTLRELGCPPQPSFFFGEKCRCSRSELRPFHPAPDCFS